MKIKVDYKKHYGKDGTVYSQTITITKNLMELYNLYLMDLKQEIDKKFLKSRCYSSNDLKIKSTNYLERGLNYTTLIHLDVLYSFINKYNNNNNNKIDFKRILYRNTLIKVVQL